MPEPVATALTFLATYLVASIPFGLIVGKAVKNIDIREHGSGNIGASNVGRVVGWGWFPVVMLLDLVKGFAPVFWVARTSPGGGAVPALCGLVAILGHIFPAYLKLRGGRGVATGVGVVLALDWRVGVAALGVWVLILLLTRFIAVASILAALAVPVTQLALDPAAWQDRIFVTGLFILAPIMITLRHIPNIKRLIAGTEDRLWARKST